MRHLVVGLLLAVFSMANAATPWNPSVDDYLVKWDRFAQGDNSLAPALREGKAAFESHLTDALVKKNPEAPSRLVFYGLVQVGGSIPVDTPLGRAWAGIAGTNFPVSDDKGHRVYFAADFYAWWKAHGDLKHEMPLLREWAGRDWPRSTLIPMYERLATYRP